MKKRVLACAVVMACLLSSTVMTASASQSLDSIINGNSTSQAQTEQNSPDYVGDEEQQAPNYQAQQGQQEQPAQDTPNSTANGETDTGNSTGSSAEDLDGAIGEIFNREETGTSGSDFIDDLGAASDLTKPDVEGVKPVTNIIQKVAAFLIQVLMSFLTLFLGVSIILDLIYVNFAFTRDFLGGGARPASTGGAFGGTGYGSNNFGGGGYGGSSFSGGAATASKGAGRQWVSDGALAAAASGAERKEANKAYLKSVIGKCILLPVLIVVVSTGSLQNLGFIIGGFISEAIGNLGNMI